MEFSVPYRALNGRCIAVVGSIRELGGWVPENGLRLNHNNGIWSGRVLVRRRTPQFNFQYKYIERAINMLEDGQVLWELDYTVNGQFVNRHGTAVVGGSDPTNHETHMFYCDRWNCPFSFYSDEIVWWDHDNNQEMRTPRGYTCHNLDWERKLLDAYGRGLYVIVAQILQVFNLTIRIDLNDITFANFGNQPAREDPFYLAKFLLYNSQQQQRRPPPVLTENRDEVRRLQLVSNERNMFAHRNYVIDIRQRDPGEIVNLARNSIKSLEYWEGEMLNQGITLTQIESRRIHKSIRSIHGNMIGLIRTRFSYLASHRCREMNTTDVALRTLRMALDQVNGDDEFANFIVDCLSARMVEHHIAGQLV